MTTYNAFIPQPADFLSNSQQDLLNNFSSANTSFGFDHYAFNDATDDNGKHNKVTTPIITGTLNATTPPTTLENEPILYALAPYPTSATPTWENFTLQYSRGGSDAVPTPLTTLQSPATPIELLNDASTVILDFNGITLAYFNAYAVGFNAAVPVTYLYYAFFYWDGAAFTKLSSLTSTEFIITNSGTELIVLNNDSGKPITNVFWTLEFLRIV
jgi:hypothetical protein